MQEGAGHKNDVICVINLTVRKERQKSHIEDFIVFSCTLSEWMQL